MCPDVTVDTIVNQAVAQGGGVDTVEVRNSSLLVPTILFILIEPTELNLLSKHRHPTPMSYTLNPLIRTGLLSQQVVREC